MERAIYTRIEIRTCARARISNRGLYGKHIQSARRPRAVVRLPGQRNESGRRSNSFHTFLVE
jgi:hypothetical protein